MIGKPTRGIAVDRELVKKLYQSGLSMSEIGRRTGHDHGVIAYHLYRMKVPIRTYRLRKPNVSTEKIIELYNQGESMPEIAEKFDITAQSIFQRLIKAGIKIRSIGEALKTSFKTGRIKKKFGNDHHSWKGGRNKDKDGYIVIVVRQKRYYEHRVVWEKAHGKIPKGYIIHHLNGIRDDNRLKNLTALPRKRHSPATIIEPHQKRIRELEKRLKELKYGE